MIAQPSPAPAGDRPATGLRLVASEPSVAYDTDPVVGGFTAGLDGLLARSLDELDEPSIEAELGVVEQAVRRLQARRARAVAVLADRHGRRAAEANPTDKVRARERAKRQVRNELADEHGWTKGEAKDNERLGKALNDQPELAGAAEDGEICSANTIKLGRFLQGLTAAEKAKVEARLLEAARTQDPVTFGRTIDQIRAELSPQKAERAEIRRHAQRKGSVTDTPDGMTRLFAEFATVDGALVKRAIDTYRRHDSPGEYRRPEQRTADAIVDMARASLEGATPPRAHGVKPHVVVTVPVDVLLAGAGMADLDGRPVPLDAIRHLMDDAGWSFVVTKTNTRPLAVTGESRTVPAGLWRALSLRDQGCIHEACDALIDWCEVMHLETPYRHGGGLSLETAGLGCRTHHRAYDDGHLELHWQDHQPVLRKGGDGEGAGGSPRAGPAP